SRRNYCAVWERRHDLGLRSQQSRQRHVQYARIAVVAHCKRHLKVVTRMQSGWKLEMAFAKCARLTKQRVDLFLCGSQFNSCNEHRGCSVAANSEYRNPQLTASGLILL